MFKTRLGQISLLLLVVVLFLVTRLVNLTSLPVFADEAIYIRWSQVIKSVETLRFIPLTDGKQPLFMWLVVPLFSFITDPLVAGRLISVLAGLGLMLALGLAVCLIAGRDNKTLPNPLDFCLTAVQSHFSLFILAAVIYLVTPFSFFFDRLALADNLLSFFGVAIFILTLLQARYFRFDLSLIMGILLGLAYLTKSPAIYFFVLSPLSLIFLAGKKTFLIKNLFLIFTSIIIGLVIYNLLRLGPQFQMIAIRNQDYVYTLSQIITHPFDPLKPHLIDTVHILNYFVSWPLLLFFVAALINLKFNPRSRRFTFLLLAWWILPLIANAAMAKVFTARYILFTLPYLLMICLLYLHRLAPRLKKLFPLFIFLITLPNLVTLWHLSFSPFNLNLPSTEQGYVSDWTSGWGIKSAATYLRHQAVTKNVIVGTEGFFGTLPDGLQIYTNTVPRLTIFGVGLGLDTIPAKLIDAKNYGDDVYLLINQNRHPQLIPQLNPSSIIQSTLKPDGDHLLLIHL